MEQELKKLLVEADSMIGHLSHRCGINWDNLDSIKQSECDEFCQKIRKITDHRPTQSESICTCEVQPCELHKPSEVKECEHEYGYNKFNKVNQCLKCGQQETSEGKELKDGDRFPQGCTCGQFGNSYIGMFVCPIHKPTDQPQGVKEEEINELANALQESAEKNPLFTPYGRAKFLISKGYRHSAFMSSIAKMPVMEEKELRKLIIENSSAKGFDIPEMYKVQVIVSELADAIIKRFGSKRNEDVK